LFAGSIADRELQPIIIPSASLLIFSFLKKSMLSCETIKKIPDLFCGFFLEYKIRYGHNDISPIEVTSSIFIFLFAIHIQKEDRFCRPMTVLDDKVQFS